MVATVIMVVLVGLVIQITSEVLKVWSRSSGKLAANAEARIAMDMITQDLETAVFRNNGQQWLRVEAPLASGGDYTGQTVGLKLFSPHWIVRLVPEISARLAIVYRISNHIPMVRMYMRSIGELSIRRQRLTITWALLGLRVVHKNH